MEDFKKELSQYFYLYRVEVGRFIEEENITLVKDGGFGA